MKRWFEDLLYRFNRFMSGRYGNDELNMFLSAISLMLILLTYITKIPGLSSAALVLILFMTFRAFSKNYSERASERDTYLAIKEKVVNVFNLKIEIWKNRKTHRYFKCKNCKATLRVPKGKGKIEITCRKCGHKMRKKS